MSTIRTRPIPCEPDDHELVWVECRLRCQVCGRAVPAIVDCSGHGYRPGDG